MAKQSNEKKQDKPAPLAPIAAVRLERDGVKACGRFKRGEVYRVPGDLTLEEAHRLVRVKGFTRLSEADVAKLEAEKEKDASTAGEESTQAAAAAEKQPEA